jgi:membrane-associated phospholipid phosphatase
MADRNLLRNQYSKQRRTIVNNFKTSQSLIPMVDGDLLIPHYRGVYSKGFAGHTGPNGIIIGPNPTLYSTYIEALRKRDQNLLNQVYLQTGTLTDAHCVFDIELEGKYKSTYGTYTIPPAPSIRSLTAAAELLEVYVMSLLRNFNFHILDTDCIFYKNIPTEAKSYVNTLIGHLNVPSIRDHLNHPSLFENGDITPDTLFRGISRGDLIGPYVSQFFYYETAVGNLKLEQKYQCLDLSENIVPDISNSKYSFLKTEQDFVSVWNGASRTSSLSTKTKYMTNLMDLVMYINRDQIWESIFVTASLLLSRRIPIGFFVNPTRKPPVSRFVNLGPVDLYNLMTKATKLAMNATWVWKWTQLRPRPEEMAYQVHLEKTYSSSQLNGSSINFPSELINSPILNEIAAKNNGKYMMPLAYSQGSPFHPSYPGGHATIAGAMVAIMKAWFNCDSLIPAVVPDLNGENLVLYRLESQPNEVQFLRIEDELNKIATNCSHSRNMAGIHYRMDSESGIALGEQVAIDVLKDEVHKYSDEITFRFRRRNGEIVTISNHNNPVASGVSYPSTISIPDPENPSNTKTINYVEKYAQGLTPIYSTAVEVLKLPNGKSATDPTDNDVSIFSNNSLIAENQVLF